MGLSFVNISIMAANQHQLLEWLYQYLLFFRKIRVSAHIHNVQV